MLKFELQIEMNNKIKKIDENIKITNNPTTINEITYSIIEKYDLLPKHFKGLINK